jgi:hypothetical protein
MRAIVETWALISVLVTNMVLLMGAALAASRTASREVAGQGALGRALLLVRPFRGIDAGATAKHASLLHQSYRPYSVRFVCTSRDDPGLSVARFVCSMKPDQARCLVAEGCQNVVSDKARNMIAAWRANTDPFVGFCDSDLALPADALTQCMQAFDHDEVGAVFAHCIIDSPGALGRISMLTLTVDAYAIILGCARMGVVPFLEGGLMILRREAVDRAGGIDMVAGAIGDDTRLGRQLRRAGYQLRLAPFSLVHRTELEDVASWLSRYRRWLACHRAEARMGFWAELTLNPTVASFAALFFGPPTWVWKLALVNVFLRMCTTLYIDRALLRRHGIRLGAWSWLRPAADLVHFCVAVSVIVYPWITWRGIRYRVGTRSEMVRAHPRRAPSTEPVGSETEAAG